MSLKHDHWHRALVIGASSGIGEAIARRLAGGGCDVALVARRADRLAEICDELERSGAGRCLNFPFDVRDAAGAAARFQEIATALGGLDLVVYAAGIMPLPAPGESQTACAVRIIETNFSGAVAWLNEAAERFSIAGQGTIVGISSVAGDRGRRPHPVYGATKAALNSYLSSLRSRLAGRGVTVLTVKPGLIRTPMNATATIPPLVPVMSAERAAQEILVAAAARKRTVYVPGWWRWVMLGLRAIPAPIMERLPF
ncbi:MAG TPA: SDR family NAD(P)-dependent oxidoreductase [Chloroflexota bacterium]|nr:SDR family NAD(P)-dependent oxidoreductase [Chloroflexota bacterium]